MNSAALKSAGKSIARRLPFRVVETVAFPAESQWHRYGIQRPGVRDPSVLLFTLHKVASTFTNQLLAEINSESLQLRRMDWDKYVYNMVPRDTSGWIATRAESLFEPEGYCYGVFRGPLPIPEIDRYRVLMILRDPRDILTSYYFSEATSHAEPLDKRRLKEFRDRRALVQAMTIDEYVLDKAPELEGLLDGYMTLSEQAGVQPLTYELMMNDWDQFMLRVGEVLNVTIEESLRERLREKGQIGVEHSGDESQHRRKGTPGDHRHKLQPETVDALTARFERHLRWMSLDQEPIEDRKSVV